MWNPFKRKTPPGCKNCEHYSIDKYEHRCNNTIRYYTTHNVLTGETDTHRTDARRCLGERDHSWFTLFYCGKSGRFFKDKRKYT